MSHEDQPSGNELSRRNFLKTGVTAAAALGGAQAGLASAPASATATPADDQAETLVFVNGRIYTMDARNSLVSSVTIKDGRFTAVGNGAQAQGPGVRVINLRGRTVVPGIVESHIHVVSFANRPGYHVPTENATSIRDVQETLAAHRPGVPEGQFITSMGGWHPNMFAEHRLPTLAELDAAVFDRPVFMYQGFTGPAATNTVGKNFFENASAPLAGPVTVGADGFITAGAQAERALYHLRVRQTFDDKKRSTADAMAYAASVGLTAMLDQTLFPIPGPPQPNWMLSNLDGFRMYASWLAVHREGRSIVRLQTNFLHNQGFISALGPDLANQLPELRERLKNQFQFFGDDMMNTGSIGEWAAPIVAPTNANGYAVWSEAQRLCAQAQWRNENAVSSLAQLEQVATAYEAVNSEFGISDLRWVVHHVPFVSTEVLTRLRALGCGVAMRGFTWITGTPTSNGAPFRTILDHGIKAGLQGDGVHISTLNPWHHMHYATTGINALGVDINSSQNITRQEALRLFTRENAWFHRKEDRLGSIEVGKLGDLVVLNKDYFSVADADIKKIRSVMTVVDGTIVYDAGVLK